MPRGLEYLGTHQMPLIFSSEETNASTSSIIRPRTEVCTGIHLNAEIFGNGKVAVIAGHGAQKI